MTAATALAATAGAIAALGVTELARGWTPRRRRSPLRRLARAARTRAGHRLGPRAPRDLAARLAAAGLDTPLAAAGAFLAPDLLIRRRTQMRTATIDAELGDVLDLLRVAVAAGLSPGR